MLYLYSRPSPPAKRHPATSALESDGRTANVGRAPCLALAIGLLGIALYALKAPDRLSAFASGLMFAAASAAAGALFGFLFGVPRTKSSDGATPSSVSTSTIQPNTNLEQISDWLTKILVGVTLVQLGTIRSGAQRLFNSMAPSLGNKPGSAAVAGAIVIYFAGAGFISSWLMTRLYLAREMSEADQP